MGQREEKIEPKGMVEAEERIVFLTRIDHGGAHALGEPSGGLPTDAEESPFAGQHRIRSLDRVARRDLDLWPLLPNGSIPEVGHAKPPVELLGLLRRAAGPQAEREPFGRIGEQVANDVGLDARLQLRPRTVRRSGRAAFELGGVEPERRGPVLSFRQAKAQAAAQRIALR